MPSGSNQAVYTCRRLRSNLRNTANTATLRTRIAKMGMVIDVAFRYGRLQAMRATDRESLEGRNRSRRFPALGNGNSVEA